MNCHDFSKLVGDVAGKQKSQLVERDALMEHAASCSGCGARLETERALTAGLAVLAIDERKFEAPAHLRSELLIAFENHAGKAPSTVGAFPSRSNWVRWALAAAAIIILGFVLLSAPWALKPETNETAKTSVPDSNVKPGETRLDNTSTGPSNNSSEMSAPVEPEKTIARSNGTGRHTRRKSSVKSENVATQVASTEVKSEFVPLTYLNDATAMDSGIVVRVEIAREQLATLGLPFDLERADEIIKADIVLGDDGVARAIRLVQ